MMEFFWERNSSSENLKIPPDYNKHHHNIEFPSQDIDLEDLLQNKSSFLQIPLPVILERIEKGNHLLHDLVKIFQVFYYSLS